ncbi:MAG: SCO family protein [Proteobacteria bacterium]|nr:SCO family protein [Pseudomonadota bacterium]MCP4917970.1 SCO family protein [Pseudomonadota bacterium]
MFAAEEIPPELQGSDVVEKLGDHIDPTLQFVDQDGQTVELGDYLDGETPVLLTLNYYRCETLCSIQLNALMAGLQDLDWTAGEEFRIVTVSIDPREGSDVAGGKREAYLEQYGRGDDVEWDFLTGDSTSIKALADSVGFGFKYDAATDQFAHPAAYMFLSGDGKVARYLYGLQVPERDLRFALIEAAEGRVGSPVDRIVLSCFQYDHVDGEYSPAAFGVMRVAGALSVFGIGSLTFMLFRREKSWLSRSKR